MSLDLVRKSLQESVASVSIKQHANLACHVVGQFVQLLSRRDWDEEDCRALFDRELSNAGRVVYWIDSPSARSRGHSFPYQPIIRLVGAHMFAPLLRNSEEIAEVSYDVLRYGSRAGEIPLLPRPTWAKPKCASAYAAEQPIFPREKTRVDFCISSWH